jgi:hypothetical protein
MIDNGDNHSGCWYTALCPPPNASRKHVTTHTLVSNMSTVLGSNSDFRTWSRLFGKDGTKMGGCTYQYILYLHRLSIVKEPTMNLFESSENDKKEFC